ncbi:MAG: hypothetical protein EXQ98_01975 [Alphaproteobacteria bacterium]|nr:hypothetical protein [Alphaproteobacteria bacterium]
MRVPLRALAHTRSGDKGDISNIVVVAYEPEFYAALAEQLTPARVKAHFKGVINGAVERYEVPRLGVLNFVAHGALGGGVSRSLCLDNYGKALGAAMLSVEIEIPDAWSPRLRGANQGR